MKLARTRSLALAVAALVAAPALGSGFSIYEQSAKASGQAGAWVARADDAAANWYNPAALTRLEGMNLGFGTNLITVGYDTTLTSSDPAFGLGAETSFDSEGSLVTPSHFYFTHKVNDSIAWGVGLNTPFGLATEWRDQPVTLSAKKSELVTYVVNPNIAFAVGGCVSLAVGVDYIFADITEFSRDVGVNTDADPEFELIGTSDLTGDGDDWGYNVALHYAADDWQVGLSYRAEMSPQIEGDVDFEGFGALAALFPDGPGSATLDLPAQAAIGFACTAVESWEFEIDIAWAGWSSFEELAIDFANETAAVQDVVLREDWEDTFSFRFGAAWDVAEKHQVRFGGVFDQAPTQVDTLRPSIPDGDRIGATFGYGYRGTKWNIDAYYMPLLFDDSEAEGSALEGVIDGTYESFSHLIGASFNVRF